MSYDFDGTNITNDKVLFLTPECYLSTAATAKHLLPTGFFFGI